MTSGYKAEYQHNSSFTNTMLFNVKKFFLQVIAQVDQKFIICSCCCSMHFGSANEKEVNSRHLLVAFDQHAVHERIRLEKLIRGLNPKALYCDLRKFRPTQILSFMSNRSRERKLFRSVKNLATRSTCHGSSCQQHCQDMP